MVEPDEAVETRLLRSIRRRNGLLGLQISNPILALCTLEKACRTAQYWPCGGF